MELTTERLIIRLFRPEDVNDVHEYCSQSGVGENAGWPAHQSIQQTSQILMEWINSGYKHAKKIRNLNRSMGKFQSLVK